MSDNTNNTNQSPTAGQPGQPDLIQPAVSQSSVPVGQPPESPAKPVILLVEDDPLLHRMYKAKMEAEGLSVLLAEDGLTGLKVALSGKVDFIVLDVMMPKLSGIDLLIQLRQNPKGKDIPVIVLSNLTEREKAQKALQLGAKEYLIKANLTPGEVAAKVKQYLGNL